jgi:D-tyrosyl-tRNA(Tyr) deacylase
MRAVVQRVSRAKVTVEGQVTGEIPFGLMVLLGVGKTDTSEVASTFAEKVANLRIFEDDQGKMNRSLIFQAMMSVELVNEGPVTILLDSEKTF